jgi:hypothetical protein
MYRDTATEAQMCLKEIRIATFFDTGTAVVTQGLYVIPCKYANSCFYQVRPDFCASKSGSIVLQSIGRWESS